MPRNKYHDTPVVEFHEAFGAPIAWTPGVPPPDRRQLRCELLLEEMLEFFEASGFIVREQERNGRTKLVLFGLGPKPDLTSAADALADIRYVTDGASLEWGIPLEKCLREVHRSNMSKLDAEGKPLLREDGKILKGPHFTPPDLGSILNLYSGVQNG